MQSEASTKPMQSIHENIAMDDTMKIMEIFCPGYLEKLAKVISDNRKFAYYTTADTARKILESKKVWLRNAAIMNDYSEITYGLSLFDQALSGPCGDFFKMAANSVFPSVMERTDPLLPQLERDWRTETYLSCLSLHKSSEDLNGRLSMWRAYGDVALIINSTPFTWITDSLGVYSTPVHYLDKKCAEERLRKVAEGITRNRALLRNLGEEYLINQIVQMKYMAAISTKHPGFAEEKEWRVHFRTAEHPNPNMEKKVVVINKVPQEIWALPLKHDPDNGLHHADIPSLLDKIIVGPTRYPYVCYRAFVELLERADVQQASEKVVVSEIPLRTQS